MVIAVQTRCADPWPVKGQSLRPPGSKQGRIPRVDSSPPQYSKGGAEVLGQAISPKIEFKTGIGR